MTDSLRMSYSVSLRAVELEDAALIVKLRTTGAARAGLQAGASSEPQQREWLQAYFERHRRNTEHYFIIQHGNHAVGAVRIYNIQPDTGEFTWGSWVIQPGTPAAVAWNSVILVYDFAFGRLGLQRTSFEVMADNHNVIRFHRGFGARVMGEKGSFVLFSLTKEDYTLLRSKFLARIEGMHASS